MEKAIKTGHIAMLGHGDGTFEVSTTAKDRAEAVRIVAGITQSRRDGMRFRLHQALDAWLNEVEADQPDGEMGEGAKFCAELYRNSYTDDGDPLWAWTIELARTVSQQ